MGGRPDVDDAPAAFTDMSQDGRGLMVLNRGLPAVEVTRRTGGTQIALTLLRSVGWLAATTWPRGALPPALWCRPRRAMPWRLPLRIRPRAACRRLACGVSDRL